MSTVFRYPPQPLQTSTRRSFRSSSGAAVTNGSPSSARYARVGRQFPRGGTGRNTAGCGDRRRLRPSQAMSRTQGSSHAATGAVRPSADRRAVTRNPRCGPRWQRPPAAARARTVRRQAPRPATPGRARGRDAPLRCGWPPDRVKARPRAANRRRGCGRLWPSGCARRPHPHRSRRARCRAAGGPGQHGHRQRNRLAGQRRDAAGQLAATYLAGSDSRGRRPRSIVSLSPMTSSSRRRWSSTAGRSSGRTRSTAFQRSSAADRSSSRRAEGTKM